MTDPATVPPRRPLLRVILPLLIVGWIVAAVRLALDATAPEAAYYVGVYWILPMVLFYLAMRGDLDGLGWPRFACAMLLTALLVWLVPNFVAYAVGQFQGWTHGRFAPRVRSAPVADTPGAKLAAAAMVAGGTTLFGAFWMVLTGTVFGWLPAWLRRRRRASGEPDRVAT